MHTWAGTITAGDVMCNKINFIDLFFYEKMLRITKPEKFHYPLQFLLLTRRDLHCAKGYLLLNNFYPRFMQQNAITLLYSIEQRGKS